MHFSILKILVAFIFWQSSSIAFSAEWLPISEEDRLATYCPSDPEAGSEYLYALYEYDDESYEHSYRKFYFKKKIYNERAVKELERIHIFYHSSSSSLKSITARVIKPDGSIIKLDSDDIYTQVVQEDNDSTFKKQSFVPPHLEVGDIFEFQYLIKLNPGYYAPSVYICLLYTSDAADE